MNNENENYVKSNVYKMNNKELESISGGDSNNMDLSFSNYRMRCHHCDTLFSRTILFNNKLTNDDVYCPNCRKNDLIEIVGKDKHTSFLK